MFWASGRRVACSALGSRGYWVGARPHGRLLCGAVLQGMLSLLEGSSKTVRDEARIGRDVSGD